MKAWLISQVNYANNHISSLKGEPRQVRSGGVHELEAAVPVLVDSLSCRASLRKNASLALNILVNL